MFFLGLSIALLFFPLGFALGFNTAYGDELRKFNASKGSILRGVIIND